MIVKNPRSAKVNNASVKKGAGCVVSHGGEGESRRTNNTAFSPFRRFLFSRLVRSFNCFLLFSFLLFLSFTISHPLSHTLPHPLRHHIHQFSNTEKTFNAQKQSRMSSPARGTRPPRTKGKTSSTTSSTVKSILFGIAVAYGATYIGRTVHFVHDLVHDLGLLQGDITSFNTHGCTPVAFSSNKKGKEERKEKDTVYLEGCEDVHVHQRSGLAFAPCAKDVEARKVWFPPAAKLNRDNPRLDGWLKDVLVVYDIEVTEPYWKCFVFGRFSVGSLF